MKLIQFPEVNVVYGYGQVPYLPLPAHLSDDQYGEVTCCWQLSWRERLRVLFTGFIWHQMLTFKQPLQPQLLRTIKPRLGLGT